MLVASAPRNAPNWPNRKEKPETGPLVGVFVARIVFAHAIPASALISHITMKTKFLASVLALCAVNVSGIAQTPSTSESPKQAGTVLFHDDFSNPSSGWVARKTD
jgi:hypothetical protein